MQVLHDCSKYRSQPQMKGLFMWWVYLELHYWTEFDQENLYLSGSFKWRFEFVFSTCCRRWTWQGLSMTGHRHSRLSLWQLPGSLLLQGLFPWLKQSISFNDSPINNFLISTDYVYLYCHLSDKSKRGGHGPWDAQRKQGSAMNSQGNLQSLLAASKLRRYDIHDPYLQHIETEQQSKQAE